MESLNTTATRSLAALLEHQPTTAAKVTFAWRIAAGPTLGRAAEAGWDATSQRLRVKARSPEWRRELTRARPVMMSRLKDLLGADVVKGIVIE